jgi:hypothetical protein
MTSAASESTHHQPKSASPSRPTVRSQRGGSRSSGNAFAESRQRSASPSRSGGVSGEPAIGRRRLVEVRKVPMER